MAMQNRQMDGYEDYSRQIFVFKLAAAWGRVCLLPDGRNGREVL